MRDGMPSMPGHTPITDPTGKIVLYLPSSDMPPSQRLAEWESRQQNAPAEHRQRMEMTASLEAGITDNPSFSTAERGDDPMLRRPTLPQPQQGHLPVITDRRTSWRSPAEIAACRWPDFQCLDDLVACRIVSAPCTPTEFQMRLVAAGQPEHRCRTLAVEATEAGWFLPEGKVVHWPSNDQLAAELDRLTTPSWTPRPPHTGSQEPTMSPNGDIPSWAPAARTASTGLPKGISINARAEVLAKVQANLAEVRRLLRPRTGLTLRGSRDDWA